MDTKLEVFKFFKDNPNPSDEQFHKKFEDELKLNIHEVESTAYALASKLVQFMTQGRANEKGITSKDVDPKELAMGEKIEMEHIKNRAFAHRIAIDHLAEIPDYYTRLKKMEAEAGIKD